MQLWEEYVMGLLKLETQNLTLEFDSGTGSLVGLYSKVSDWNIIKRPHLGLSWRLMIPLEGKRNNQAWGNEQDAPEWEADENHVAFTWNQVKSRFGGTHNIKITTKCCIEKEQAVFFMQIQNRDDLVVENVYYPCIGDLHRPEGAKRYKFMYGAQCNVREAEMYPTFPNRNGSWSMDQPTFSLSDQSNPPLNPMSLVCDEKGSSLVICATQRRMEACAWFAECLPGWSNTNDFRVFEEDSFGGKDVYIRFSVGHLPFVAPGMDFELLPFALDACTNDWAGGIECYQKWADEWENTARKIPGWVCEPHSWLQLHINSPEDELRMRFTDLPKVGEECKKYGIRAIQLVGWNHGGQDRNNPCHDPDPRLGTFEELKEAIRQIREMGVKVILFAKFTWADQSRADFEQIYRKYAAKDPYGNYYVTRGYNYQSLSQMTDVSTRRLIPMCFGSAEYREICNREFQKCVDLGADGILFDEGCSHGPSMCCFDTSHGHRYGESIFAWDETLINGFREIVGDREFLFAGEELYDFQYQYYDFTYFRSWGRDHKPNMRRQRPHRSIMTSLHGFNDRAMVNQSLLNRYIMSYEPYMFKGMPSDASATIAYGNKMDALRTQLREYFWDGTFKDKEGGKVMLESGENMAYYSVFETADGKKGMIICNYTDEPVRVIPILDDGSRLTQYRLVDDSELTAFADSLVIPADSAAAVI